MSRITPPVTKLARSLSSSSRVAQPSYLFNSGPKAGAYVIPKVDAKNPESADSGYAKPRTVRLMQTFHTATVPISHMGTQPIDAFILPQLFNYATATPPASVDTDALAMRMPLLPDNNSRRYAPEPIQPPLPEPEILVVAANPDNVLPAALTEVEGMGVDGVELKFAHEQDDMPKQFDGDVLGGLPKIAF